VTERVHAAFTAHFKAGSRARRLISGPRHDGPPRELTLRTIEDAITLKQRKAFGKLSSRKVPQNALLFSCIFLLAGLALLYAGDSVIGAFTIVTSVASVLTLFVWSMILISYIVFRRRRPELHAASAFKMPGSAFMPYVVLGFFVFMLVALAQADDTRIALVVAPLWFLLLGGAWHFNRQTPLQQARIEDWKAMSAPEDANAPR
jgi:D-serine/D-alanine/glycine transporter